MKTIKPRNLERAAPQAITGWAGQGAVGVHEGQAVEVLP